MAGSQRYSVYDRSQNSDLSAPVLSRRTLLNLRVPRGLVW